MPSPTDDDTPFPSFNHVATLNGFGRSHLSPDDAHLSPPRRAREFDGDTDGAPEMGAVGERSRSRRRKRAWKKLMWVKQSCTQTLLLRFSKPGTRAWETELKEEADDQDGCNRSR